MFINPQTAIDNGWIAGITDPAVQVQPNAIDFTIDHLYTIDTHSKCIISQYDKVMRGGEKVDPVDDYWHLNAHTSYDGMSNVFVTLPEGVACQLVIRSTFNRNGIFLTSGLYDSGYTGPIGFALHNNSGSAMIMPGTRVGQIIFVASDSSALYSGGYNREPGEHWSTPPGVE